MKLLQYITKIIFIKKMYHCYNLWLRLTIFPKKQTKTVNFCDAQYNIQRTRFTQ